MPKKKMFEAKVTVNLPEHLMNFLEDMVRTGYSETISGAIRKCIAVAKTHLEPEFKIEVES